ncbi:hypothetical protein [Blastococcus sp. Marseille-P5729]|uniref:hypothetical protein n=1 Tax=Blastococcus sp. Marseille-P5729 TaxID=2086582 RepID=UPI00131BD263|nr:hypothetical protein [Blastococcus sp. Marseille-P5729]
MVDPRERVNAERFEVNSTLPPDSIVKAGRLAAQSSKTTMTSTVHEDRVAADHVNYVVKGPGGFVTQMRMSVHWSDAVDGRRRVTLEIDEFKVIRQYYLSVIPGPRVIPALKSLRKFSTLMREKLA